MCLSHDKNYIYNQIVKAIWGSEKCIKIINDFHLPGGCPNVGTAEESSVGHMISASVGLDTVSAPIGCLALKNQVNQLLNRNDYATHSDKHSIQSNILLEGLSRWINVG